MRKSLIIPIVLALDLFACTPIVVRVGKRTKAAEVDASVSYHSEADAAVDPQSWNSIEDFLQNLDGIKRLGRDALLKRYHEEGRARIRDVFRQFRDTVKEHSLRDPSQDLPYLGGFQAGTCVPIKVRDVFDLGPYGDLRSLLETVFLARIRPTDAIDDPASPGDMDEITKLGFFELGIAMEGDSYFEAHQDKEMQGSDLRWKVIHEQSEPEEWAAADEQGVQFRFLRTQESGERHDFILEARVGEEVYEETDGKILPSLFIDYQRILSGAGESFQSMTIRTGLRDPLGLWRQMQLSRQIIVTQDINQGHILHVEALEHFEQANEIQEKFRLDMDAQNLCSEVGSP